MEQQWFSRLLLRWHEDHHRPLPWKGLKDPYPIWLSEIILQQTRVEQGLPYFQRFLERFPTLNDLAAASEEEVFKLWEGLGYYSRARNLMYTARYLVNEADGEFPKTYEGLLKLKGVGPYTAAAIGSFAFDLPTAVVDGNVYRVLSRVFDLETPIDSGKGKKQFAQLANELLPPEDPGGFNQAIMDLGASVCTPRKPDCPACPFQDNCLAEHRGTTALRPVRSKRPQKKNRFFQYILLWEGESTWIRKRTGRDIWENLYELPLVETDGPVEQPQTIRARSSWLAGIPESKLHWIGSSKPFRQTLTHQQIHARFWIWKRREGSSAPGTAFRKVHQKELETYPWPRLFNWFFKDQALSLVWP